VTAIVISVDEIVAVLGEPDGMQPLSTTPDSLAARWPDAPTLAPWWSKSWSSESRSPRMPARRRAGIRAARNAGDARRPLVGLAVTLCVKARDAGAR
jgi:hypothetical protein